MYQPSVLRSAARSQLLHQNRAIWKPAYNLAKKVVPKISVTEAAALKAGTVGFDRDIFAGSPSLDMLKHKYALPRLTAEEQAFMDNETEKFCQMLDDYQIVKDRDMPKKAWDFLRQNRFLGMIIPKKYGGLGFTAHGHSQVVVKIASRSGSAAISVSGNAQSHAQDCL